MKEVIGFEFVDWKRQLLLRRGLNVPDGRALYSYRLTDEEFNSLESLLCNRLSELIPRFNLDDIAKLPGFADLFVLYAAEWWRLRYDGSGFNWEPILRDIGADPEGWSANQRSEYVKKGFKGWQISLRDSGGMRFIGSVAVQGGLPLKLLASSRGTIGQVLSRVLRLASGSQITKSALQVWVESLANTLPQSYRQGEIYTLLTDVAWTVLDLRQKAKLSNSRSAVEELDRKISYWRDRFPLPIEDEHARGMIEQLIRDSVRVRIERQLAVLPVERLLEKVSGDEWELSSNLSTPKGISSDKLASFFSIDIQELPRRAELMLQVGSTAQKIEMRRLAGQQEYRLERKPLGFSGDSAIGEHLLHLVSPDGRVWIKSAIRGDELDFQLPWVFVETDSRMHLIRQGSGSVTAQQALVALPENWRYERKNEDLEVKDVGIISNPSRKIISVRGLFNASSYDNLKFRLRTGRADSEEEFYAWAGDRLWLDFIPPRPAFKGMPELYRVNRDGEKKKVIGRVGISTPNGGTGSDTNFGPLYLRYPESGDVQYRMKLLILPELAKIATVPVDASSGKIHFANWGVARVRAITDGVEQNFEVGDQRAELDLVVKSNTPVPELVELEAYWPRTQDPIRFRLPFPARGVRVFDGEGNSLSDNCMLAVQQLYGVRILVLSGQVSSIVELRISGNSGRNALKYPLHAIPGSLRLEIKLQDYLIDIHQLFSVNDSPDEQITVNVFVQGVLMFTLLISRYSALIERDGVLIRLKSEGLRSHELSDLEQTSALAIRLESPDDEALILESQTTEGVETGAWKFLPSVRSSGSWLIYPSADSKVLFRPTLWPIDGKLKEEKGLPIALSIGKQSIREQSIDMAIETLASDFLNADWEMIEKLISEVGHLPLPTLDVWRRFARSPKGMAAMALRWGSLKFEFVTRFSAELPFAWETITFEDWKFALRNLEVQCVDLFGEEDGSEIFERHLEERVQKLRSRNGLLSFLLGILIGDKVTSAQKEAKALKMIGLQAQKILFEGSDCKLMNLRRSHADDEWPSINSSAFTLAEHNTLKKTYLYSDVLGFQFWIVNGPIVLALQVVTDQTTNWFNEADHIHVLRNLQAFDPDWFEEAYNWTIAQCFANELLD